MVQAPSVGAGGLTLMLSFCRHTKLTTPRKDAEGEYCRCLDCTARIPWTWPDDFSIPPPRVLQAGQPVLAGEERIFSRKEPQRVPVLTRSARAQRESLDSGEVSSRKEHSGRHRKIAGALDPKQVVAC
jgi:hypothetical protein